MLTNVIIIVVLLAIAISIGLYLYKAKKHGVHCIGCPYSKQCESCNCCGSSSDKLKSK